MLTSSFTLINAILVSQWHCLIISATFIIGEKSTIGKYTRSNVNFKVFVYTLSQLQEFPLVYKVTVKKYANSGIIPEVQRGLTYIIVLLITHS